MNMLTAYYIDNLAKDHWQQAREANQYNAEIAKHTTQASQARIHETPLKSRFSAVLSKLHLAARTQP